jgi:hypothetical protein
MNPGDDRMLEDLGKAGEMKNILSFKVPGLET